jgi:hypothetical protein
MNWLMPWLGLLMVSLHTPCTQCQYVSIPHVPNVNMSPYPTYPMSICLHTPRTQCQYVSIPHVPNVNMSPYPTYPMSICLHTPCFHTSYTQCQYVSIPHIPNVNMSPYLMYPMSICLHISCTQCQINHMSKTNSHSAYPELVHTFDTSIYSSVQTHQFFNLLCIVVRPLSD